VKLRTLVLPALLVAAWLAPSAAEARVHHFHHTAQGAGVASWYGPGFHGHRTANGERFNTGALTAAHRSLPFGTRVRVTCGRTGRSVVVRINDRGPYAFGRIIDLSYASARAIGMTGTDRVTLARL
jgi:rare lipoprotein A